MGTYGVDRTARVDGKLRPGNLKTDDCSPKITWRKDLVCHTDRRVFQNRQLDLHMFQERKARYNRCTNSAITVNRLRSVDELTNLREKKVTSLNAIREASFV